MSQNAQTRHQNPSKIKIPYPILRNTSRHCPCVQSSRSNLQKINSSHSMASFFNTSQQHPAQCMISSHHQKTTLEHDSKQNQDIRNFHQLFKQNVDLMKKLAQKQQQLNNVTQEYEQKHSKYTRLLEVTNQKSTSQIDMLMNHKENNVLAKVRNNFISEKAKLLKKKLNKLDFNKTQQNIIISEVKVFQ